MEARVVVVCLFVAAIVRGEQAPTGLCRANERLLECGCPRTCRDPAPDCAAVCRTGCFCEDGEVRNDNGICVKLADCPPILSAYKQDTSEPRPNGGKCPDNEEYRYCEPCNKTCDRPNPMCPAQCSRGCFCKDGLLRDRDGRCVAPEKCSKLHTAPNATQHKMTCKEHQVYTQCETMERTCNKPNPRVPSPCQMGCFCDEGYVKSPNGQCVKLEECPKAQVKTGPATPAQAKIGPATPAQAKIGPATPAQVKIGPATPAQAKIGPATPAQAKIGPATPAQAKIGPATPAQAKIGPATPAKSKIDPATPAQARIGPATPATPAQTNIGLANPPKFKFQLLIDQMFQDFQPSHHNPSVEDCAPDEEYFSCGWCEPSCSEPSPSCPNKVCIRGCLCRPPLLRHHTGYCVDAKECFPERCKDPNEEFVCLYGCELRCDKRCVTSRYCVLGCYCRIGLLRNNSGFCVVKDKCSNSTVTEVKGTAVDLKKKV